MAKGGGGSELWDIVGVAVVGIVAYFAFSSGALDGILKGLTENLKGLSIPSLPGRGGAGGGTAAPGGSTGTCTGGPYKGTGKVTQTEQRGPTERHYASGKADTTTIEKNASFDYKNYQFVSYVTLQEVGSDDNISVKLGGTHDGGWFDHGISFSGKKVCLGTEKSHPNTDACLVEGPGNIGDLKGKKIGIAGVYFANNLTELWYDIGGGWKKGVSSNDVGGFKPDAGGHEAQLRIDDAPKLTIHCSTVQEIAPMSGAATAAAFAQAYRARAYRARSYSTRFETIDVKRNTDCGSLNY